MTNRTEFGRKRSWPKRIFITAFSSKKRVKQRKTSGQSVSRPGFEIGTSRNTSLVLYSFYYYWSKDSQLVSSPLGLGIHPCKNKFRYCWYQWSMVNNHVSYCLFLRRFRKLRKATISFVMSVRPSALKNSAPIGRMFMKFYI